jgi:hypothetical protein
MCPSWGWWCLGIVDSDQEKQFSLETTNYKETLTKKISKKLECSGDQRKD